MISLKEKSGFNEVKQYFENNKNKKWSEWLTVIHIFNCGKQGITGIMKSIEKEFLYVFKISQNINYLIVHENNILNSLLDITDYCPNFCRSVGSLMCEIDPYNKHLDEPFKIDCLYPIEKELLLMEYINNSVKFYKIIKNKNIENNIIYSIIKQVLCSIKLAQKEIKLTHYDLHSNNIMIRKCDDDLSFLYIIDDKTQFLINSFGYFPTIIDFGFSYSKDVENDHLHSTLNHTEIGYINNQYDGLFDIRLFLITVSKEIVNYRKNKKLRKIVKNIFYKLKPDWNSGWNKSTDNCATDDVLCIIQKYFPKNSIFSEFSYQCIDIIQSLIILPLQKQKIDNIEISFQTFIKEFSKIENYIGNKYNCLYILKNIIDIAKDIRIDYINKNVHAVQYFKFALFERLNSISKFCNIKNVHFEKILCSLYSFSKSMECVLFNNIKNQNTNYNERFKNLHINTTEQIYTAIDINFPEKQIKNKIMVIDAINKKSYFLNLTDKLMNKINKFHSIQRGIKLYETLFKKHV